MASPRKLAFSISLIIINLHFLKLCGDLHAIAVFTCKKLSVKNPPYRLSLERGSNDCGMATFGLRYFAQLRSKNKSIFWRVEIAERGCSGPSEVLEFAGGLPLSITWENRG